MKKLNISITGCLGRMGRQLIKSANNKKDVKIISLTEKGACEITLLGQNVNSWHGVDALGKERGLAYLILEIAKIKKIKRIRYTTSHPLDMEEDLILAHKEIAKLMPYLHLPIQSGSDRVLSAMKRNYTTLEYKSIIRKLRKQCPDISITSDFIIGFPTETLEDFNSTKTLMEELKFDYSYSFIYSSRPGTPASYLKDITTYEEKLKRLHDFQTTNIYQGEIFTKKMLGSTQRILIEAPSKRKSGIFLGKTDNNRIVEIEGEQSLLNQFVKVKIDKILDKNLHGIILN